MRYVLKLPLPEENPVAQPGQIVEWNNELKKYTFTVNGLQYEIPASEVEGNTKWFRKLDDPTPGHVIRMITTPTIAKTYTYTTPLPGEKLSEMTPEQKQLIVNYLTNLIKELQ